MTGLVKILLFGIIAIFHMGDFFGVKKTASEEELDVEERRSKKVAKASQLEKSRDIENLVELEPAGYKLMKEFDSRAQAIEEFAHRSTSSNTEELQEQQQRLAEIRNFLTRNMQEQKELNELVTNLKVEDSKVEKIEIEVIALRAAAEKILNGFDKALVLMADRVILSQATIDLKSAQNNLVNAVENARLARTQLDTVHSQD